MVTGIRGGYDVVGWIDDRLARHWVVSILSGPWKPFRLFSPRDRCRGSGKLTSQVPLKTNTTETTPTCFYISAQKLYLIKQYAVLRAHPDLKGPRAVHAAAVSKALHSSRSGGPAKKVSGGALAQVPSQCGRGAPTGGVTCDWANCLASKKRRTGSSVVLAQCCCAVMPSDSITPIRRCL